MYIVLMQSVSICCRITTSTLLQQPGLERTPIRSLPPFDLTLRNPDVGYVTWLEQVPTCTSEGIQEYIGIQWDVSHTADFMFSVATVEFYIGAVSLCAALIQVMTFAVR